MCSRFKSIQVHVSDNSTVADHCKAFALSDPKDNDYNVICDHQHNDKCDRCDEITSTIDEIEIALQEQWKARHIEEVQHTKFQGTYKCLEVTSYSLCQSRSSSCRPSGKSG